MHQTPPLSSCFSTSAFYCQQLPPLVVSTWEVAAFFQFKRSLFSVLRRRCSGLVPPEVCAHSLRHVPSPHRPAGEAVKHGDLGTRLLLRWFPLEDVSMLQMSSARRRSQPHMFTVPADIKASRTSQTGGHNILRVQEYIFCSTIEGTVRASQQEH